MLTSSEGVQEYPRVLSEVFCTADVSPSTEGVSKDSVRIPDVVSKLVSKLVFRSADVVSKDVVSKDICSVDGVSTARREDASFAAAMAALRNEATLVSVKYSYYLLRFY